MAPAAVYVDGLMPEAEALDAEELAEADELALKADEDFEADLVAKAP